MAPFGKDPAHPHERQRPLPGNGDHAGDDETNDDDRHDRDDTDEHEQGHRRQLRRSSDVRAYSQADGARVIVISPKMLVVAWGIVVTVVPAMLGALFWLGGQMLSPRQAIESVRAEAAITRDSLTALSQRNFRANQDAIQAQNVRLTAAERSIGEANERINLNTYLNCVTVRYIDARLEPRDCRSTDVRQFVPKP
jgi:hypothetical protein